MWFISCWIAGMSERTLARKLSELNFTEILQELRRDLAVRYLDDRKLHVSKIAWAYTLIVPARTCGREAVGGWQFVGFGWKARRDEPFRSTDTRDLSRCSRRSRKRSSLPRKGR
jgi:hypothetical protein